MSPHIIHITPIEYPEVDCRWSDVMTFLMLKTELEEVDIFTELIINPLNVRYATSTYAVKECRTTTYQGIVRP